MENQTPSLHVTFFNESVLDKQQTAQAGRPIHKDVEMVQIKFPGDNKRVHVAPAKECALNHPETGLPWTYKERFPRQYEAFRAEREYIGEGTPLSEVTFLTKAQVKDYRSLNIHTVETLASVEGAALTSLGMGGREQKNKAIAYLKRAEGVATDAKLQALNEELQARIEALEAGQKKQAEVVEEASTSPFETWDIEQIKTYIQEATGERPKGNPSKKTLLARADELNKMAEEEAA